MLHFQVGEETACDVVTPQLPPLNSCELMTVSLNSDTIAWVEREVMVRKEALRVAVHPLSNGGRVIDFGCESLGGIEAGKALATICLGTRATVQLGPANPTIWEGPQVIVSTDAPVEACMASQYAGWKISHGNYFAMGSGPMRAKRGNELVLDRYDLKDISEQAVGVLESDTLPNEEVLELVAKECGVAPGEVVLCVAPTSSIAGVIQVVARSIETSLHKLFELGFDLRQIQSGFGSAPMPPVAKDFVQGIGRTNDAILYGGHVTLWVNAADEELTRLGPQVPSETSKDFGRPFAKTFKEYEYDFYKVDPGLFAPAVLTMVNLRSGKSYRFGRFSPGVLQESFGEMSGAVG